MKRLLLILLITIAVMLAAFGCQEEIERYQEMYDVAKFYTSFSSPLPTPPLGSDGEDEAIPVLVEPDFDDCGPIPCSLEEMLQ